MPIRDVEDAVEVRDRVKTIFDAPGDGRAAAVRALFVEELDFEAARGEVGLGGAPKGAGLPPSVERVAQLDGVHAVYLPLETARVRKADLAAAAKTVSDQLDGDLLLVVSNHPCTQLQLVYPSFEGARPVLRRMVVERDLPQRTAIQQVAGIYRKPEDTRSIRRALDDAFDVEPVTREFFREYKRVFQQANDLIAGFDDDAKTKRRFVLTLFNRLMFIYFLSRKGWLSFKGDKDYLKALWDDYQKAEGGDKNFHRDRLQPLFFLGLSTPQSCDINVKGSYTTSLLGDVCSVNGGLFQKTDLDRQAGTVVPDKAIKPILRKLFDRFNFTVTESTPFDVEVAVDPEMLGKVFEELVTGRHDSGAYYTTSRHDSGAYYTPRPVVSFMCREALKVYLEGRDTGVARGAIAAFVDRRKTCGISSVASARKVAEALDEVTVVDPACGSGAYLLGMMQELVELQTALFNVGVDEKGIYELKLHIIQRNLYGVDIDDFAVNIAMLRLWLSLAIEYEGEKPEPLPNLDFKVLCGDSLLGPDPSAGVEVQGALGYDADRVRALGELKAAYMRASEESEKSRLRREIKATENAVRDRLGDAGVPEGVINWRVDFAEVFGKRGGFDVAIANPPYVNMVTMDKTDSDYRDALRLKYNTARGAFDIFVPFIERGMQTLSPNGLMVYITPNKVLAAEYAKTMRAWLVDNSQLVSITDLSNVPIFAASVYPVVIIAKRGELIGDKSAVDVFRATGSVSHQPQIALDYSAPLSIARRFGNLWSPLLAQDAQVLLPLLENCERIGDIAAVSASATVDEAYKWKEAIIDGGGELYERHPGRYRPFIVSGNIRPYLHTWEGRPVQYIKRHYHRPVLDIVHPVVSDRRREQVLQEKLIISGMSKRLTCVYDQHGIAAGTSTVLVIATNSEDNAFICGLLNSDIMQRFYKAMFGSLALAGGFMRFGTPQIRELPLPKSSVTERKEIADLVRECSSGDPTQRIRSEHLINEAVSALFGNR